MGKSKKIAPQAVDPLRPEFRGLSNDLGTFSRNLLSQEFTPYEGQRIAPITGQEQSALNQIGDFNFNMPIAPGQLPTVGASPFASNRNTLVNEILSGSRLSPGTNPFLADVISNIRSEGQETLGENANILDAIFAKSGMSSGSPRTGAQTNLSQRVIGDVNENISSILAGQFNLGRQEQQGALGLLPQFRGLDLQQQAQQAAQILSAGNLNLAGQRSQFDALGGKLNAASLPRLLQQAGLDFDFQEFMRKNQDPTRRAMTASQILSQQPGMQFMNQQLAPSDFQQASSAIGDVGQLLQGVGQTKAAF